MDAPGRVRRDCRGPQTQTDKVVQLALNKEGVIRGNLQDSLTDKVMPVVGAVNKEPSGWRSSSKAMTQWSSRRASTT